MPDFDLVIRNGEVAAGADVVACDVGIVGGRIVALGERLAPGATEIDAAGKLVLPGGVDGHCHLDQPMDDGSQMADDFRTGTISAACGGTTTVIPFACQAKGGSLRAAVDDYHRRADGKAVIDYAFHLIVSDPTEQVTGQELPALIEDGYTSFKIYMTYDDLKLDDRQMLETLTLARRHGAMVMVHAENSDCIGWLTEQLELAGRCAGADRSCVGRRGDRADSLGTEPGTAGLCRDLPAISVSDRRRYGSRWFRGREMYLQPAATRQGKPGGRLGRPGERALSDLLLGSCGVSL
jgi:dihydropyrimidinase